MAGWSHRAQTHGNGAKGAVRRARTPHLGAIVAGGAAIVLVVGMVASMLLHVADASRVYNVAEARANLAHNPGRWIGRTVLMRAVLVGCPPSPDWGATSCPPTFWRPALADPVGPGARHPLPVTWGGPDPRRVSLGKLPVVGRFAPGWQTDSWGSMATYRVRLEVAPANTLCGDAICYVGVLVDAGT